MIKSTKITGQKNLLKVPLVMTKLLKKKTKTVINKTQNDKIKN